MEALQACFTMISKTLKSAEEMLKLANGTFAKKNDTEEAKEGGSGDDEKKDGDGDDGEKGRSKMYTVGRPLSRDIL